MLVCAICAALPQRGTLDQTLLSKVPCARSAMMLAAQRMIFWWRSVVLRLFAAYNSAAWGSVYRRMRKLMSRIVGGEVPSPEDQQAMKKEKPAAILTGYGARLPPSTGTFPNDPATCQHLIRIPRGNAKSAWWTCKDCGSRWQRTDESMEMRRQPRERVTEGAMTEGAPKACPKCSRPLRRVTQENCQDDIYGCTGYPRHCKFAVEVSKLSTTSPGTVTGAASSSASRAPAPASPPPFDSDTTEEEDIVMIMQSEARGQRRRRQGLVS